MVKVIKENKLIGLMVILLVFAALSAHFVYSSYESNFCILMPDDTDSIRRANWGALGDYFGGLLNPIFAFLGLIMLCATLYQSQKELSLTRDEIKRSTEALKDQAETQKRQRFEGTFFQLLTLHQEIVGSIDTGDVKGRDCFKEFYYDFKIKYENAVNPTTEYDTLSGEQPPKFTEAEVAENKNNLETINQAYLEFYEDNQSEVGHYFRNMYNIIKFINNSNIEDKKVYSNLLRAQLSVNELMLLFYNCLSNMGYEKFKPLIEEYALLKSLPKKDILDEVNHPRFYSQSAFGE